MNWISLLGLEAVVARWRAAVMEGALAAEDRLELAQLEWQEHKHRLRNIVMLALAIAVLTVVALVLLSLALVVQFWDTPHRTMATWSVAGVWLALWIGALVALWTTLHAGGGAFALTRRELAQDWRDIKEQL